MNTFYKNESDYNDALVSAALNTCGNCGEVVADLHKVHESETPFHVCDECYAEIDAMFEREAAGTPNPADAQVLAAMRKPAGRETLAPAAECEHVNVRVEDFSDVNSEYVTRYEAITCCDCGEDLVETRRGELLPRKAPAAGVAAPAPFTIVERWDGTKWIEVRLVWNGTQYAEVA